MEIVRPVKKERVIPDPNDFLVKKQNIIKLQENNIKDLELLTYRKKINKPENLKNNCIFIY